MKFYIAGPYVSRGAIRALAGDLSSLGLTPTSSWLNEPYEVHSGTTGAATALPDEEVQRLTQQDLEDVEAADVFILLTPKFLRIDLLAGSSGGRHVETGIALAKGIPVIVVGEPENIFHRHAGVRVFSAWWHMCDHVLELWKTKHAERLNT